VSGDEQTPGNEGRHSARQHENNIVTFSSFLATCAEEEEPAGIANADDDDNGYSTFDDSDMTLAFTCRHSEAEEPSTFGISSDCGTLQAETLPDYTCRCSQCQLPSSSSSYSSTRSRDSSGNDSRTRDNSSSYSSTSRLSTNGDHKSTNDSSDGSGDNNSTNDSSDGSGDNNSTNGNSDGSGDHKSTNDSSDGSFDNNSTNGNSDGSGDHKSANGNSDGSGDNNSTNGNNDGSGDTIGYHNSTKGSGDTNGYHNSTKGSGDTNGYHNSTKGSSASSGDNCSEGSSNNSSSTRTSSDSSIKDSTSDSRLSSSRNSRNLNSNISSSSSHSSSSCTGIGGSGSLGNSSPAKFMKFHTLERTAPADAASFSATASETANPDGEVAIVDSGCSKHMLNENMPLLRSRERKVWMTAANGEKTLLNSEGDFELPTADADGTPLEPLLLNDCSQLRGSPLNLLSISVLCDQGTTFNFEKRNSYFVYKGKKFRLEEKNGLYLLRLDDILKAEDLNAHIREFEANDCRHHVDSTTSTAFVAATYNLWHERFGHADPKRLKFLYDNASVEGMDVGGKFKLDRTCRCETCKMTNNRKLHIGELRKHDDDVTRKGQLIYSDICGPFPTSVEGYRYCISFTDVYLRFSAAYFLKRKSEATEALRQVIIFYKKNGIVISRLRTDNGGEFGGGNERTSSTGEGSTSKSNLGRKHDDDEAEDAYGSDFQRVCDNEGITHELMPAHRPELHGIAERWNSTISKMANSMLYATRTAYLLWPSAFSHANALRNRLPVRGLGVLTPYEIFYGKRPRVDDLRVFGCDCYRLLPTYPKIPGQASRKRLIYVGMTADRVGWRCFDPITFQFTTEYELIFDEYSHRKRINYLREFDLRRTLMKQGKLRDMKLQTNDFAKPDAGQDAERRLYADPSKPPVPLPRALNSGGDDSRANKGRDKTSPRTAQSATGEARNESKAQGSTTTIWESDSRSAPGHSRENAAEGLETSRRGANHPDMEQANNEKVS